MITIGSLLLALAVQIVAPKFTKISDPPAASIELLHAERDLIELRQRNGVFRAYSHRVQRHFACAARASSSVPDTAIAVA
jgi:hypothetical protein